MKRLVTLVSATTLLGLLTGCSAEREFIGPEESRLGEYSVPVVGGQPANENQFYSTVAIWDDCGGGPFCTGTLVSPTTVVTAAHCFADEYGQPFQDVPNCIYIVHGVLDTMQWQPENVTKVSSAAYHPSYPAMGDPGEPDGMGDTFDIAVLELEAPVTTQPVAPVLAEPAFDHNVQPGKPIIVTGYGVTDINTQASGVLYIAETPFQKRVKSEIFAGGVGNPDSCQGDSGGPAYTDISGTIYLAGATSRGSPQASVICGEGGIYTMVGAHNDWLMANSNFGGSVSPPLCGNTVVEEGEQCDDGNTVDGDGCNSACQNEAPPPDPKKKDDKDGDTTYTCTMAAPQSGSGAVLGLLLGLGLLSLGRRRRR